MTAITEKIRPIRRFLGIGFRATRTLGLIGIVVYFPVYFLDTPVTGALPLGLLPATLILTGIVLAHLALGIAKHALDTGLILSGNRQEVTDFDL